jgi:hypothetical protein
MQPSPNKLLACAAFAAVTAAVAYPAIAHHSTTMFNHAAQVSISGVVKEVHWTNPHARGRLVAHGDQAGRQSRGQPVTAAQRRQGRRAEEDHRGGAEFDA